MANVKAALRWQKLIRKFCLILIFLSYEILADNFSEFIENDIGVLEKSDSCLQKKYLSALEGDYRKLLCYPATSRPLELYYNMQSDLISSFNRLDYAQASKVIIQATHSKIFLDYVDDKKYIDSLLKLASSYNSVILGQKETLNVMVQKSSNSIVTTDKHRYSLDTGTKFLVSNEVNCYSSIESQEVSGVLGASKTLEKCLIKIGEDIVPSIISSAQEKLLGSHYILSYKNIFNLSHLHKNNAESFVQFYFDGSWIFFQADLIVGNTTYGESNICIDSGAKSSYLAPRLYRQIRDSLKAEPVVNVSTNTVIGAQNSLGKVVKQISINNGSFSRSLSNVPIFFRNDNLTQCDAIIGFDVFSSFTKIDTTTRRIYFQKSESSA